MTEPVNVTTESGSVADGEDTQDGGAEGGAHLPDSDSSGGDADLVNEH